MQWQPGVKHPVGKIDVILAVRCVFHDHRPTIYTVLAGGHVDIGGQVHTIAHGYEHVLDQLYAISNGQSGEF